MKPETEGDQVAVQTPRETGAPLKERRLRLQLSQVRLSAMSTCSLSSLQMYERGLVPLRPTPALADLFATLEELEAEAELES
jgi:transcriptional regulator with XRE-family HTH domain